MEELKQAVRPVTQEEEAMPVHQDGGGAMARASTGAGGPDGPAGRRLDLDHYAPFLLAAVHTAWSRQIAGPFRDEHDLGVVEWRVLALLSVHPGASASQLCALLRMDKSAISRSLHLLSNRGYLDWKASAGDIRRRSWWLSESGQELFEALLEIALEAEARLLEDVSEDELEGFLAVMRKFLANLERPEEA